MSETLEQVVNVLRQTGLTEIADEAEQTLHDPVDSRELARFCAAHGLSRESLTDRMGGSP
jgi:hypothetical protein